MRACTRESLQADDEVLCGAGDHGPAAGVDGVLVPAPEHAVRVDQPLPDGDQRLHCTHSSQRDAMLESKTRRAMNQIKCCWCTMASRPHGVTFGVEGL